MTIKGLVIGHSRLFAAILIGLSSLVGVPSSWASQTRGLIAWDVGSVAYILLISWLFAATSNSQMEDRAEAQQEGEWTLFWLVVAGATASFVAIIGEFGSMKAAVGAARDLKVGLVAATLLLSWLLCRRYSLFAMRMNIMSGPELKTRLKPDWSSLATTVPTTLISCIFRSFWA